MLVFGPSQLEHTDELTDRSSFPAYLVTVPVLVSSHHEPVSLQGVSRAQSFSFSQLMMSTYVKS